MRRRRGRARWVWLLVVVDVALGAVLWQAHGAGVVVLAAVVALVFGVFLPSRGRGRRRT